MNCTGHAGILEETLKKRNKKGVFYSLQTLDKLER